ncbi:hypothetical protein CU098_002251, partial [Rhizopus stolonifer]
LMAQMDSLLNSSNVQNIQLLNCCRVLTRIMPFIFESPEHSDWEDSYFWTPRLIEKETADSQKSQYDTLPPRGEILISLTLKSLFLSGLTLPSTVGNSDSSVNYVIWETGVGCSTPIGSSRDNDMNRTEILRLLTVLLSKSISPATRQIVISTDVGDKIEDLEEDEQKQKRGNNTESNDNIFRHYLSKLHRGQDFQFLIDGIYRILNSPMQLLNNYIPGSLKRVRYHVEMLMLCWKLLETNKRFSNYLMETERGLDLMVVLVFYANENKLDPSQVGLVRTCTFMLQTLSSNRIFSVKINKSFDGHASLPASSRISNFQGTYANYLIISIYSLIASSKGALSTLYPALIITITNISPYLKHLSPTASSKLLILFSSMSAAGFLLADEANHKLIEYLLEAFNNIIRFQFSDNLHFIHALLYSQQKFERLANFDLNTALNERHLKEIYREEEGMSEKAKGKLPDNTASLNSSSSQLPSSYESLAHFSGGKDDFVPTNEWVDGWYTQLSLTTVISLINHLKPQLEKSGITSDKVVEYLKGVSLSDISLPPSTHSVTIRKFQWVEALVIWFQSMLWGHTYISSVSNYGPWNNTQIKLFHIKHQQQTPEPLPPFASQPASPTTLSPRSSLASPTV